uniref:Reverse transcriptase Ty1/copia-type domain-containing protein n=1 Tax=Chromera velia CCMP2878 TaxID=1169474 RepID=A0A0G4F9H3_9ALVE|eukprot:Cvel_193.t1-p1 / transcript=Cvel_193.t1 / gene=Cvel_193 / organism=Chromera_velia_CCMP2878 / gene_product=Putative transposon Ty5-1 protein YCL074W, putative / transcript_product=Putative transposon Ty5-1 protein YCL074W, putative / location=Cvel_scaffold11:216855-222996(+) / protein_length=1213 / sequence_SO=supercontig / SO=protein_coding / is_pseudo=false
MEQTLVIKRSLSSPPASGSEPASALSPPDVADHAPPAVGVEKHIEVSPPDVSGASSQAGQGDPPSPVPPVSDSPHPVAEASSGNGPPAPLPAPSYPHSALPTGHQAAYYPIGTPGPGFPGFAPPQVTPVPPASGFFPSAGPYATPADQIYDPSWLLDTLDSLYFGPYESHVRKHWRAVKALCPLANESIDTYFARAAKVFGRLRRLVPAMAFGSEPFVPFEYSILLQSLPTEGGAHRYVLAHLQDYTPMGLRDCLRRYKQQLGTPTPSVTISSTIWFSSAPPSRSSSTSEPNHPKCIYCRVTHLWRKHVKCIACGASPHADRSTCPAIAHVCGCGKQGHLDAMRPSKLRASKKAANVHCATVSFAFAAVTSPNLVHGPHFGMDDGATVKAVALAQRLSVKIDYKDNVMVIPSPSGPDVTLTWIDLGEYYGLPLVGLQDDDSLPSLVGSDESDDERPPLEDNSNESEDEIDNSAPFCPLPFAMYTTTSPTTTLALHSPSEGSAGIGVPVSTGEAPEGVCVCVSWEETPESVCMSVSPEETSVPSGEGVEGLKEPARPGGIAGEGPGWFLHPRCLFHQRGIGGGEAASRQPEAAAFVLFFGPDPMTESPPDTVMFPVPPIPAPLPPADLPAVHATDPPLSSQPIQQPIPESAPPATPPLASPFPVMPAPLQPGTMVIGRSPEHSLLWVGEILGVLPSDGAAEGDVRNEIALNAKPCKRRGVDLSLQKADIVQTYLQAPLPPDRPPLAAIPPSDHPDHGQFLWVLRKAVYGLPDAGKVFEDFLTSVFRSLGWEPMLFPGVWVLRRADGELRALLATYCDDPLILGIGEDAAATIDPLKDIMTCGDYTDLSEGCFIAVQFDLSTTGVFCHQHDYVASLALPPDMAGSDRCADKLLPIGSMHKDDTSPLLSAAGVKVFRTLLGQVGYVATRSCTQPDVALAHSYLSRFLASPTERALRLLLQTVRYLRSHPSLGIHVRPSSDPTKLTAIEHGDSSFGNAASLHLQMGWVVFINNSPLIWKSRRQSRISKSTTRAEVLTLEEGIDAALHFANCAAPFYSNIRVGIGYDAVNVLSLLLSGTSSSAERALLPIIREIQDKACVVPLQAATDLVEQHRISIFKIPTESNISDLLTKALDLGALTRLMSPSPSLSPVFGSEIVFFLPPLALRDHPTMERERIKGGWGGADRMRAFCLFFMVSFMFSITFRFFCLVSQFCQLPL